MSDSIPEYYRHLAEQRDEEESPDRPADRTERAAGGASGDSSGAETSEPSTEVYRADAFQLELPAGEWQDRSVYTLTGPTIDGIQHNITILFEREVEAESLYDFAAQQIASLEVRLDSCHVLLDDEVQLASGRPAYRAIYVWKPEDDLRLYQEQVYVLHEGQGYTLTASFTRKTRKKLGPEVERMMLSFSPLGDTGSGSRARAPRG